jgi:hypothetical protein
MPGSGIEWGSVADWVSGLGSFAAVVTALWLARTSQKVKLSCSAGLRVTVGPGRPPVDVMAFSVTNIGVRTTIIRTIGMRVGRGKKAKQAVIMIVQDGWSQELPKTLADGESGSWNIPLGDGNQWLIDLTDNIVTSKRDVEKLQFIFGTSNGGQFYEPAEKSLQAELIKVVEAQAATKSFNPG